MRLALQTDYALRTLMYLAARRRRATVKEIAQFFGISAPHIAKVVNQLSRHGFVRSIRGIGGGMELIRSPEEISLGEVVLAFEGNLHLLDCISTDGICVVESFCKLKGVLAEAERLQLDFLNSVTLADVVPKPRQLARIDAAD